MQASKRGTETVLWVPSCVSSERLWCCTDPAVFGLAFRASFRDFSVHALAIMVGDGLAHGWSARMHPVGYQGFGPFRGPLYNSAPAT